MNIGLERLRSYSVEGGIVNCSASAMLNFFVEQNILFDELRDISLSVENYYKLFNNLQDIRRVRCIYSSSECINVIRFLTDYSLDAISVEGAMNDIWNGIVNAFKKLGGWIKQFFQWIGNGLKRLFGCNKVKATANSKLGKAAKSNPKVRKLITVVENEKDVPATQKLSPGTAKVLIEEKVMTEQMDAKCITNLDAFRNSLSKKADQIKLILEKIKSKSASDDDIKSLAELPSCNKPAIEVRKVSAAEFSKLVTNYSTLGKDITSLNAKLHSDFSDTITEFLRANKALGLRADQKIAREKIMPLLKPMWNACHQYAAAGKAFITALANFAPSVNKAICAADYDVHKEEYDERERKRIETLAHDYTDF